MLQPSIKAASYRFVRAAFGFGVLLSIICLMFERIGDR